MAFTRDNVVGVVFFHLKPEDNTYTVIGIHDDEHLDFTCNNGKTYLRSVTLSTLNEAMGKKYTLVSYPETTTIQLYPLI